MADEEKRAEENLSADNEKRAEENLSTIDEVLSADGEERADGPLLYDPLFETPPDTVIRDTPGKGFFGKAPVKKAVFIIILSIFVGVSISLSFGSLTKDRFKYEETDDGYMLSEFNASKTDDVLTVDFVLSEDGTPQKDKTVTAVREWALCCNDYTSFILIGKDVREISNTSFYTCTALQAVLVDPENPYFLSDKGVLYRQENGEATELMLYPARNDLYRATLALGAAEPADEKAAREFVSRAQKLDEKSGEWREAQQKEYPAEGSFDLTGEERDALLSALKYEILPGVTRVGETAFAENRNIYEITIPEGVREFASMAFYKCGNLRSLRIPDLTETIGSDAFSYCSEIKSLFIPESVKTIGHHAFFGCDGVDEVRMECAEADAPETGEDWMPQKRKFFLHDVPIVFSSERGSD